MEGASLNFPFWATLRRRDDAAALGEPNGRYSGKTSRSEPAGRDSEAAVIPEHPHCLTNSGTIRAWIITYL